MSYRALRDRLLDRIGDRAEAEVVVFASTNALTRFANSFIHQNVSDSFTEVNLTIAADGRVARASSRATDDERLDNLIEHTLQVASMLPVNEQFGGLAPPADVPDLDHHDAETASASPELRAGIVSDFVAAGEGLKAAGYCDTIETVSHYGNSTGHMAEGSLSRAVVDGIHQTASSAGKAHQASIRISDLDGAAAGALAASKARAAEDAFDLKPGRYEVVLEPNAVGTIAFFLGYYGFNGLAVVEGRSFAELGDERFDPAISLRDDGINPEAISLPFDGDGTPVQQTRLIDGGTVVGHAHDRSTAIKAGKPSTGNALWGNDRIVGPIPTSLFLDPGQSTRAEMIASVERGLLVTEFNYCRVLDPMTVGVTGLTRNGTFMIENGAITGAVTNLRFTQSFVESLAPGNVLGCRVDLHTRGL